MIFNHYIMAINDMFPTIAEPEFLIYTYEDKRVKGWSHIKGDFITDFKDLEHVHEIVKAYFTFLEGE